MSLDIRTRRSVSVIARHLELIPTLYRRTYPHRTAPVDRWLSLRARSERPRFHHNNLPMQHAFRFVRCWFLLSVALGQRLLRNTVRRTHLFPELSAPDAKLLQWEADESSARFLEFSMSYYAEPPPVCQTAYVHCGSELPCETLDASIRFEVQEPLECEIRIGSGRCDGAILASQRVVGEFVVDATTIRSVVDGALGLLDVEIVLPGGRRRRLQSNGNLVHTIQMDHEIRIGQGGPLSVFATVCPCNTGVGDICGDSDVIDLNEGVSGLDENDFFGLLPDVPTDDDRPLSDWEHTVLIPDDLEVDEWNEVDISEDNPSVQIPEQLLDRSVPTSVESEEVVASERRTGLAIAGVATVVAVGTILLLVPKLRQLDTE